MTRSMTGFATARGGTGPWSWSWDLRSVNGRGLDLRLRVPDWIEGLEQALRAEMQKALARGSVTLSLRIQQGEAGDAPALSRTGLARAVQMIREIEEVAAEGDIALARTTAADILAMRGVLEAAVPEIDTEPLREAILADLPALLRDLDAMRRSEGAALATLLGSQISRIEDLVAEARALEPERAEKMRQTLRDSLARVLGNSDGADADRVAQELALIAVKSDIAEELDRLTAHIAAARALLAAEGPKGRKLDFLTQEFNREANTLCSKAQHAGLNRVGLDLKAVVDQMREQVQNVE